MNAGKVKIVLNALHDELQARRAAAAKRTAGSADDAPVLPASPSGGAHLNPEDENSNEQRQRAQRIAASARYPGVVVQLSNGAPAAPHTSASTLPGETSSAVELANTSIAEVAVPFRMSDEPLVTIAPYVAIAVLAGVVLLGLMLLVF